MTDKQIIIDGVDIAGCEFAVKPINDNRIKCHCAKGLLQIAKMQEQPESIKSGLCENNHNCYYKQLKRKEQECKDLREDIKDIANLLDLDAGEEYNFGNIDLEIKQLKAKEQECEKLTKECEIWKNQVLTIDDEAITVQITQQQFEDYNKLKAENDELKEKINNLLCSTNCYKYKQAEKLKQTLTEIKEIAEPFCNACQEFEPEKMCRNCEYCNYNNILQKISECEAE